MDGRFDELLLGMAQKHRGIEDLLYSIMSFFERRTDLFHVKAGDEKKGFEHGRAEEALRHQFRGFQARYLARAQPHLLHRSMAEQLGASASPPPPSSAGAAALCDSVGSSEATPSSGAPAATDTAATAAAASSPPARAKQNQPVPEGVNASPLEGGDPGLWERNKHKAAGFIWTQSVQEVTVEIDVEKCSASDIKVVMASRKISVTRKGETIIEGKLHDRISCEDSTWHLDSGKQLVLSLEKIKPTFWESFLDDVTGSQAVAPG
mmetsp:Transcript_97916/g.227049  ORF Transcript_97916/g.227049 Transcript_97916/m.227049 type:complete len:264 (+) Transcript_97916:78-869(+)